MRSLLILTLFFYSSFGYSHNQKHFQGNPQTPTEKTKKIIEEFHHQMEGQESISKWLEKFNLLRISHSAHRWIQMKSLQDNGSTYVKNLPVLGAFYMLSHTLEVFSGPIGVYLASDLGLSTSVQMLVGTLGVIISVPGLDPICMILFAISPLQPVQNMMTKIRVVTVDIATGVKNKLGLEKHIQSILHKQDRLEFILQNSDSQLVRTTSLDQNTLQQEIEIFRADQDRFLKLSIVKDDKATWIDSLEYSDKNFLDEYKKDILKSLNRFNLSVRYALKQELHNSKNRQLDTTKVQFNKYELVLKSKWQFHYGMKTCIGIFN